MPLPAHPTFARRPGPIVLCVMDGVGLGSGDADDAVAQAATPNLDRWMQTQPHTRLTASGTAVGLPSDADMGNSEVGHNAMGAGRIIDQGAKLVEKAFHDGTLWTTQAWSELRAVHTLHLLGLLSDGNVHSHVRHLLAIIDRAATDGIAHLRVHVLTDGRDVPARSAMHYVADLEATLARHRSAGLDYQVASGGGRMHLTMDRYEADWSMVERGWRCHVHGEGRAFSSLAEAVQTLYAEDPDMTDQWLPAFVIADATGRPVGRIQDGDGVLFFNFRGDRALEISRAFEDADLDTFDRGTVPNVVYAGMMEYDGDLHIPARYLVAPPVIDGTVGQHLVDAGRRSWACSETQKFGHVTYFFNGNRSGQLDDVLETYVEVPSLLGGFDEQPWMGAHQITEAAVRAISSGDFDHVRVNYANGDMVGHTGDRRATMVAVAVVDLQLGRLAKAVADADGVLLVTADHGNADQMYLRKKGAVHTDASGAPMVCTSHSLNPVPFVVVDPRGQLQLREDATDASIARIGATILELCGLQAPSTYLPGLVR